MKRIMVFWIVTLMLIGGMTGFVNLSTDAEEVGSGDAETRYASQPKSGFTAHAPIYINGNADFSNADDDDVSNPGAAGTVGDPYIIENWDIDANTANGIYIGNTNVYFIIRNCVIHDGMGDGTGGGNDYYGIYSDTASNGKIDNVTSYNALLHNC